MSRSWILTGSPENHAAARTDAVSAHVATRLLDRMTAAAGASL